MIISEPFHEEILIHYRFVLVEIWAGWCGASHIVAPVIKKIIERYHCELEYIKIDIDANPTIVEKYCITEIPSFLLFKNGHCVDCLKGCISETEFHVRIQTFLKHNK